MVEIRHAGARTCSQTRAVQTQESADTQQPSHVAGHYQISQEQKAKKEKRGHAAGGLCSARRANPPTVARWLITQNRQKQPFIKYLRQSSAISAASFFTKASLTPSTHLNSCVAASAAAHARQTGVRRAVQYSIEQL